MLAPLTMSLSQNTDPHQLKAKSSSTCYQKHMHFLLAILNSIKPQKTKVAKFLIKKLLKTDFPLGLPAVPEEAEFFRDKEHGLLLYLATDKQRSHPKNSACPLIYCELFPYESFSLDKKNRDILYSLLEKLFPVLRPASMVLTTDDIYRTHRIYIHAELEKRKIEPPWLKKLPQYGFKKHPNNIYVLKSKNIKIECFSEMGVYQFRIMSLHMPPFIPKGLGPTMNMKAVRNGLKLLTQLEKKIIF